jgi:hypothetical protein
MKDRRPNYVIGLGKLAIVVIWAIVLVWIFTR